MVMRFLGLAVAAFLAGLSYAIAQGGELGMGNLILPFSVDPSVTPHVSGICAALALAALIGSLSPRKRRRSPRPADFSHGEAVIFAASDPLTRAPTPLMVQQPADPTASRIDYCPINTDAAAYEKALNLARSATDPREVAVALTDAGDFAVEARRSEEATSAYEELVTLRRAAVAAAPWDWETRRGLAAALERLGDIRAERGHLSRARDLYAQSLEEVEKLAVADPGKYGQDLAYTQRRRAELLRASPYRVKQY